MFKDIPEYEGRYALTEDDQVFSYHSKKFLKFCDNGLGCFRVNLYKNGKRKQITLNEIKKLIEAKQNEDL